MPADPQKRRPTPYPLARPLIADGDVLLFRRRHNLQGILIGAAGRSPYAHAALAAWWDSCLLCLEARQFAGCRAVTLSSQVSDHPGRIDVYRIDSARWPEYRQQKAVDLMRRLCGKPYGWFALFAASLRHLPILRFFVRPELNGRALDRPPYCSMAVAHAMRAAGVDPVPNLSDRLTEPGDLARSAVLRYLFTLEAPPCAA